MPSAPRPAKTSNSASAPLRILMIHGYTQSGPLFRAKTRALEKKLLKAFPAGVSLVYPTAPIRLAPADVPGFSPLTSTATSEDGRNAGNNDSNDSHATLGETSSDAAQASSTSAPIPNTTTTTTTKSHDTDTDGYGWWRRRGDTEPYYYEGMELGLNSLAQTLKEEGPFDGVIGFSQGGSAAGLVASLLEPGRRRAFEDAARHRGGMKVPEAFWTRRKRRGTTSGKGKQEVMGRDSQTTQASGTESEKSASNVLAPKQSNKITAMESTAQDQPIINSSNSNPQPNTDTDISEDDDIYEPIHPPLKFAVSYSGYGTLNPLYAGFFNPRIRTPMLHFIGSLDTVVEERRSLMLVDACEDGDESSSGSSGNAKNNRRRVIYHPGGHFLPSSQKQLVEALVGFIRETMAEAAEQEEANNILQQNNVNQGSEIDEDMQHLGLQGERNAHI